MNSKSNRRRSSSCALKNEMRSWGRNKMEERRLVLEKTKVEKQVGSHRRSLQHDRDVVSKELEQRIPKRTPSIDEYLGKSYGRYSQWQQKERDRIYRRFKEMQRSYDRDFAMLDLDESDPLHGVRRAIIQDKTLSADILTDKRKSSDPVKPSKSPDLPPVRTEEDSDEEWERMLENRQSSAQRPKLKIRSTEDEMIEKFAKNTLY